MGTRCPGWEKCVCTSCSEQKRCTWHDAKVVQNPSDTQIIDWLERQHTLHRTVEVIYVVDGYLVQICYDGTPLKDKEWHGDTLRNAYAAAMQDWDVTHGNVDLKRIVR